MRARPAAKAALRGRSPEIMLALPQDARQPALRRSAWWVPVDLAKSAAPARVCRYCGRVERTVGTHRSYKAPHDVSGANAALPPPLRQVAFCPAHQRSWLAPALRTLYTRSVLAHISYGARPAFGNLLGPTSVIAEPPSVLSVPSVRKLAMLGRATEVAGMRES